MAITWSLVCDKCESHTDVLWKVSVLCERTGPDIRDSYLPSTRRQSADWCDKCIKEMGVIPPLIYNAATEKPKTTIEDIVREIVEESNGRGEN